MQKINIRKIIIPIIITGWIITLFWSVTTCWANSDSFYLHGIVRSVTDGDTLKVAVDHQIIKVRLYGIDAPEKNQNYGRQATHFASVTALGQRATVQVLNIDKYGRMVGIVTIDGTSLNESLLKAGCAWIYPRYCKEDFCETWKEYESQAQANKNGLWADDDVMPPWEYRRK